MARAPASCSELEACGACVLGAPGVAYSVPPDFSLITFHRLNSIDGGYYHKQGTCDCYVVDVWMFSNSNLVPYPNGFPSAVSVRGNGFDTPSSEQLGALIPTVQEDCQRTYRATRMWEKREGTDSWVEVGKRINFGSWAGGTCSIGDPLQASVSPSTTVQARKLRVAVKVLEREAAQKAAAEILEPPPP